jgi:hypothetical protein
MITYEKLYAGKKLIGFTIYTTNEDGKPEMTGFIPSKMPEQLQKAFEHLTKAKEKYPFLEFKEDDEFLAIRIFHKDYPDIIYALFEKLIKKEPETILDDDNEKIMGYVVEYWDKQDSNNDKILHKTESLLQAVRSAVLEVVMIDFEMARF